MAEFGQKVAGRKEKLVVVFLVRAALLKVPKMLTEAGISAQQLIFSVYGILLSLPDLKN